MTTQGPTGGPDPGAGGGPEPGGQRVPTDEEVAAALEEQMRRLTVPDVLVQTVVTLVNLGARKLGLTAPPGEEPGGPGQGELEEARMAIDATRALIPLIPGDLGPIRDAVSQLQVAYARAAPGAGGEAASDAPPAPASGAGGEAETPGQPATGEAGPAPGSGTPPPADDPQRERARSKIWTPPGT